MSEWISVEDKLPEIGAHVLVIMKNGFQAVAHVEETWFDGSVFWEPAGIQSYDGFKLSAEPTHWMVLPEPPK